MIQIVVRSETLEEVRQLENRYQRRIVTSLAFILSLPWTLDISRSSVLNRHPHSDSDTGIHVDQGAQHQ